MPFKTLKSLIDNTKKRKGSQDSLDSDSTNQTHSFFNRHSQDSLVDHNHSHNDADTALFSSASENSSINTSASEAPADSGPPSIANNNDTPQMPNEHGLPRRNSFESSVGTLIIDDTTSTVNTLIPGAEGDDVSVYTRVGNSNRNGIPSTALGNARGSRNLLRLGRRTQNDDSGWFYDNDHSKTLPIYATRFRSGAQVYESDLAAKVSRTLTKRKPSSPALSPGNMKEKSDSYFQGWTSIYKGKGKERKNSVLNKVGATESQGSSSSSVTTNNDSSAPSSTTTKLSENITRSHSNSGADVLSKSESKEMSSHNDIPMPPSIVCTAHTSYNPFGKSRTLFMTIYKYGGVPHRQTLLGRFVFQRHLDLGIVPRSEDFISPGGVPLSPECLNSHEKVPICKVWQEILGGCNDIVKYTIEFENPLDFEQPGITMINDGSKRVTETSYNDIRMRWYGTTGLASTFGSGFFELRFVERLSITTVDTSNTINNTADVQNSSSSTKSASSSNHSSSSQNSQASQQTAENTTRHPDSGRKARTSSQSSSNTNTSESYSSSDNNNNNNSNNNNIDWRETARLRQEQLENDRRRPPVALYHNISIKTLAATRKVGEFTIWEPGYELADIIVMMGLVLREQEQRKDVEYQHVVSPGLMLSLAT